MTGQHTTLWRNIKERDTFFDKNLVSQQYSTSNKLRIMTIFIFLKKQAYENISDSNFTQWIQTKNLEEIVDSFRPSDIGFSYDNSNLNGMGE